MSSRPSASCRQRFDRDRRAGYLRRVGGAPTEQQALIVDQMIATEWNALRSEHDAIAAPDARVRTDALRLAAEYRRQLILLDRDLARATPPPPPPQGPPRLAEAMREATAARQRGETAA